VVPQVGFEPATKGEISRNSPSFLFKTFLGCSLSMVKILPKKYIFCAGNDAAHMLSKQNKKLTKW